MPNLVAKLVLLALTIGIVWWARDGAVLRRTLVGGRPLGPGLFGVGLVFALTISLNGMSFMGDVFTTWAYGDWQEPPSRLSLLGAQFQVLFISGGLMVEVMRQLRAHSSSEADWFGSLISGALRVAIILALALISMWISRFFHDGLRLVARTAGTSMLLVGLEGLLILGAMFMRGPRTTDP